MSPLATMLDFAVAALVSAAVILLLRACGLRRWSAVALPIAIACGLPRILGRTPRIWPIVWPDAQWITTAFLLAMAIALLGLARRFRAIAPLTFITVACASAAVVAARLGVPATRSLALALSLGAALAGTIATLALTAAGARRPALLAAALVLASLISDALISTSHSFEYGRLLLSLAGAVAPFVFFGSAGGSASAALGMTWEGIFAPVLLAGYLFADLAPSSAAFSLAGLLSAAGVMLLTRRIRPYLAWIVCLIVLAIVSAIPLSWLIPQFQRDNVASEYGTGE